MYVHVHMQSLFSIANQANSPFACKDLGMQLEIIARDVTTGCSGCLH